MQPPDGPGYWGAGVQEVELRWNKAKHIRTSVDDERLGRTLDAMATQGVSEAHAPQIRQ